MICNKINDGNGNLHFRNYTFKYTYLENEFKICLQTKGIFWLINFTVNQCVYVKQLHLNSLQFEIL